MARHQDIGWRYWAATLPLLAAGLYGYNEAFHAAMVLTAVQSLHYYRREASIAAFPVQVRVAYLGLLIVAQWQPLSWIYWVQMVGTGAMVLFDYCLLARCLSLLPWNRTEPLSFKLVLRTFLSAPVPGNILQGLPAQSVSG